MKILKHCSMKTADEYVRNNKIELSDAADGVLLDDLIGYDESGNVVLLQVCYVNCWASDYTIHKAENDSENKSLWNLWGNIVRNRGVENE